MSLKNFVGLLLAIGLSNIMFNACGNNDENNSRDEVLTCDKINASASTFTTLNVHIGSTYADESGYAKLMLETYNLVNDTIVKSFIVAESEKNSKNQTFTLKDVPDEYLGNLIFDVYHGGYTILDQNTWKPIGYEPFCKIEGYKNFQLLQLELKDSELQSMNFSNKNTKIAIIYNGSIGIYAKGQMMNDDGLLASVSAEMSPDYENGKIECGFISGDLVYSNSDCDITGYLTDYDINIDIHLRKGWNKVFHFDDRVITTGDIKDSYLLWYQHAG